MKKTLLVLFTIALAIFALAGCSKIDNTQTVTLKEVSFEKESFLVPEDPKRVVVLSNSLLMMMHELGVTPVARTYSMDTLPADLEKIPTIGHTSHVNTEALLEAKPDLVIGLASQQKALLPLLQENKIPNMLVQYEGINQNVPLLLTLGKVFNKEDKAKEAALHYVDNIAQVKAAIKDIPPARVAVLFATGKSITAETSRATTSAMCEELGMINVITPHMTAEMQNSKFIPYSLESLTMDNPSIIYVVTMGKESEINKKLKETMTDNPAWNQLDAVKNDKVFYLPSNLFLLNPGLQTPEAMAQLVYDAYGITVPMK